jgi:5-methylcytosine-specific restriction protein A
MSPNKAARVCSYPGCTALVAHGSRCGAHVRTQEQRDWLALYRTAEWQRLRVRQLREEPWCEECKKQGEMNLATDVDHIYPHRGDRFKFFNGPFQSLCHSCHSRKTLKEVK